jgi:sulfur carrier protein
MQVTVNGAPEDLPPGANVNDVVTSLGRGRAGLAVAVNDEVVPRSRWSTAELIDGDRVEILTAAQGG